MIHLPTPGPNCSSVSLLATIACSLLLSACSSSKKKRLNFTSTPAVTVAAGTAYSYQAAVAGTTTSVSYALTARPVGMTVNAAGLVSWAPTAADIGVQSAILTATSGTLSGTQSWKVTVQAASPASLSEADGSGAADVRIVPWRESLDSSGEIPQAAFDAMSQALVTGSNVVLSFRWLDELGQPDLGSVAAPVWNSWRNPDTREAFEHMVTKFVELARPSQVYLGSFEAPTELQTAWLQEHPAEWLAWLAVVEHVRIAVQAVADTDVKTWP